MGNIAGGISSVMAGNFATCVVSGYGAVYCIGKNESFQLGYGSEGTVANSAIQPTGLSSNVTKMSLGNGFACAVQNSSTFCWGANEFGQLGSSFGLARYPTQVVIPNGNGVNNVQN